MQLPTTVAFKVKLSLWLKLKNHVGWLSQEIKVGTALTIGSSNSTFSKSLRYLLI